MSSSTSAATPVPAPEPATEPAPESFTESLAEPATPHVTQRRAEPRPLRVLVYSDDAHTRAEVLQALGPRPHPDLPRLEYVEVATEPMVVEHMDTGTIDLAVLDGEAVPAGGLGIARQLKDEIFRCPPLLVLIGRPQDAWLATWSRADAAVAHPLDPLQLADVVLDLLRARVSARPA